MTELLPGIRELDKDSLCHAIYSQLYHNFSMHRMPEPSPKATRLPFACAIRLITLPVPSLRASPVKAVVRVAVSFWLS